MKYILIILLVIGCCPQKRIERIISKNPEVADRFIKERISSEVTYVHDTTIVQTEGRIDTIIKSVKKEIPVIRYITKQSNREERIAFKTAKEGLVRFRLENDSMKLQNKLLKAEVVLLKEEAKKVKQETKKLKRENTSRLLQFLKDWVWWIIILAIIIISLPYILGWIKTFKK